MSFKGGFMTRVFAVLACLATLLAASGAVRAVEVTGLYEAEVPVSGQSTAERVAASRTALEEVLVKVSGNADVAQLPQLEPLLSQAEQWVQRYQYRAVPAPAVGAVLPGIEDVFLAGLHEHPLEFGKIVSFFIPHTVKTTHI